MDEESKQSFALLFAVQKLDLIWALCYLALLEKATVRQNIGAGLKIVFSAREGMF